MRTQARNLLGRRRKVSDAHIEMLRDHTKYAAGQDLKAALLNGGGQSGYTAVLVKAHRPAPTHLLEQSCLPTTLIQCTDAHNARGPAHERLPSLALLFTTPERGTCAQKRRHFKGGL